MKPLMKVRDHPIVRSSEPLGPDPGSLVKRSPSAHTSSAATRSATAARSASDRPQSLRRLLEIGSGSDGWLSTPTETSGSTANASERTPVEHTPTAPTPWLGPPRCAGALRPPARAASRPRAKADWARTPRTPGRCSPSRATRRCSRWMLLGQRYRTSLATRP